MELYAKQHFSEALTLPTMRPVEEAMKRLREWAKPVLNGRYEALHQKITIGTANEKDREGAVTSSPDPRRRQRRRGAGTTEIGYRNKNGQVVVMRTNRRGNDHNQYVYVLDCTKCGRRYGANGSDIWQRKCPGCGGGQPGLDYS